MYRYVFVQVASCFGLFSYSAAVEIDKDRYKERGAREGKKSFDSNVKMT